MEYLIQGETLTAIANAIRANGYNSGINITMTPEEMPSLIETSVYDNGYDNGYVDGYRDGENSVLSEYVDWSMMTTSNSCSIYFHNNSPTYYVHIDFEVTAYNAGAFFTDQIVIPPNSAYSWNNIDSMGWDDLSSEEWELGVVGMRFSKDGT